MIYSSRYPAPEPSDWSLTDYVFEHAAKWPQRPALRDGVTGETFTYAELTELIGATASALAELGVIPGDVVALVSPNQPWWVIALHGAIVAGGVVTPLNPAFTTDELTRLLGQSRARLVIADVSVEGKVRAAAESVGARVLVIGAAVGPDGLASVASTARRRALPKRSSADRAVLPFSSGTTGLPKGVVLTHRNLVATLAQHEDLYPLTDRDVLLASLPMFHIYGLSIITDYGLRHGAMIVTMPRFDPASFFDLIASQGVTWLHLAPPTVLLLADVGEGHDLRSVRHALSGGAPLDPGVQARAEEVLGCAIGQGYGMTEASPGITFTPADRPASGPHGSIGLLVAGTEARLVDPATGVDVEVNGAGELWVRGEQVMSGYLDDPAATAATIVEDGWLRTGDIATVDAAGYWWVVDRLKELIKYKGYQIAPAELEMVLRSHPGVADAAVVGVPDLAVGEIPVGFVVASDVELDPAQVMAWVAERVAPYKKIRAIHVIEEVPKSAAGKILRRQLRHELTHEGVAST